jgi:hypothetical protein
MSTELASGNVFLFLMPLLLAGSNLIRRLAIVLDFVRISWVVQAKSRAVLLTPTGTLYPFGLYVCVEPQADAANGPPFFRRCGSY